MEFRVDWDAELRDVFGKPIVRLLTDDYGRPLTEGEGPNERPILEPVTARIAAVEALTSSRGRVSQNGVVADPMDPAAKLAQHVLAMKVVAGKTIDDKELSRLKDAAGPILTVGALGALTVVLDAADKLQPDEEHKD